MINESVAYVLILVAFFIGWAYGRLLSNLGDKS